MFFYKHFNIYVGKLNPVLLCAVSPKILVNIFQIDELFWHGFMCASTYIK